MKTYVCYMLFCIFTAIFLCCGALLLLDTKEANDFDSGIAALVTLIGSEAPTPSMPYSGTLTQNTTAQEEDTADYTPLVRLNPDFTGWLTIPDTPVDYPVMQSISDPEFYLHRDFYKNYSRRGLPFVAADCDLDIATDNIIIYGHHMKDGSVFGALSKYEDAEYFAQHPVIRFNTPKARGCYEILAVFKTSADGGFNYSNYIHLNDEDRFNEFIGKVKDMAFYNTDAEPVFGSRLLTLSTCEYSLKDGRLVIVSQQR